MDKVMLGSEVIIPDLILPLVVIECLYFRGAAMKLPQRVYSPTMGMIQRLPVSHRYYMASHPIVPRLRITVCQSGHNGVTDIIRTMARRISPFGFTQIIF